MVIFFYITALMLIPYGVLIACYHRWWDAAPEQSMSETSPRVSVSVIIPARNEADNIVQCINSLLVQHYPAEYLEVIVVNDFSSDETAKLVLQTGHNIKLLNMSDHFREDEIIAHKKKAIEAGIKMSNGELILTTDADCILPPTWISTIVNQHATTGALFLAAPVKIQEGKTLISIFQALDFISLQGITGASIFKNIYAMCNGANLAYNKRAFYAVNGFEGIDSLASGDDMLLMYKLLKRFPGKLSFVKNKAAIVSTSAVDTWKAFFSQRIRWASKATIYKDPLIFFTLLFVYLVNLLLLCCFIMAIVHLKWAPLAIGLWIEKTVLEIFFMYTVARFFDQQHLIKYFFFMQPMHIAYTVIAGFFGAFGKYNWKGRRVK